MRVNWDPRRQVLELLCDSSEEAQALRKAMEATNVDKELPFNDLRVLDYGEDLDHLLIMRLGPVNKK